MLEPERTRSSIVDRAKNILTQPKTEWGRVDAEPTTVGEIFKNYVLILAAIPAIASLIGQLVFGTNAILFTIRLPIGTLVSMALLSYVMSVIGVYVMALIIDALAPTFKGTRSKVQAVKVAAYSWTAAWVAGIFGLLPQIAMIAALIGGLYSLYLLYLGLPRLMKVADDKAVSYVASVIVAAIVVWLVIGLLMSAITRSWYSVAPPIGEMSGKIEVPGGGEIDLEKLQAAAKQMEETAREMEAAAAARGAELNSTAP